MESILTNLVLIMKVFAVFALMYIVNIVYGIVNNVIENGDGFDKKLFYQSVSKLLAAAVASSAVSISLSIIMQLPDDIFGYQLSDQIIASVNILGFLAIYMKGVVTKTTDVYKKIQISLGLGDASLSEIFTKK